LFRRSRRVVAHSPRVVIDEAGAGVSGNLRIRRRPIDGTGSAKTDRIASIKVFPSRRQHVGKWFGQASEIEELRAVELQMIGKGRTLNAVKAYRDRTGVDLTTAKAAIDAAR